MLHPTNFFEVFHQVCDMSLSVLIHAIVWYKRGIKWQVLFSKQNVVWGQV